MAVQVENFTQDLTALAADEYTYTTGFAANAEIGMVTIKAQDVSADAGRTAGGDSPVFKGLQENVEIWLDDVAGEDYDVRLYAGSFNGRSDFVWAPAGGSRYFLNAGSELRIVVSNKSSFGTIYGAVRINTL